tara:strand:+ start:516 stop:863 length:348 start_codon:yes stop_codon:yes gene_type:complete
MNKLSPLIWLFIFLIILLPTAFGRFLLDLAGGLLFLFLLLPIFLTGIGWIGLKLLKSKVKNCDACGATFMNNNLQCPVCGSTSITNPSKGKYSADKNSSIPASSVTIDITPADEN